MKRLFNNFAFQLACFLLLALLVNRAGSRVPTGNEWIYLLYIYKAWHPHFLAGDWTFIETTAGHSIFNYATGWLTTLMSINAAAWVGRVVCWVAAFIGLMRVGRHFGIPSWAVWLGVMLWMAEHQSFVTMDWIVGSFEAKCLGYIFLLFAMDAALCGRSACAGALAGLAFSFHTAIGMWGGAALGVAVLLTLGWRNAMWFAGCALLCGLPGLITSWSLIFGDHPISPEESKFLVTKEMPYLADPFMFGIARLFVLAMLAMFAALHAIIFWKDRRIKLLFIFEMTAAGFFAMTVLARAAGRFNVVTLYPMRVYAVFAMLLFFWQLSAVLLKAWNERESAGDSMARSSAVIPTLIAGIFVFLCLPSPVTQLYNLAMVRLPEWRQGDDDYCKSCRWVADHTPVQSVLIAPPWRRETFYLAQRPLIACWHAPRYDAMSQWRGRIIALVGNLSSLPTEQSGDDLTEQCRDHFQNMSPTDVMNLSKEYGGNFLLTQGAYPWSCVFRSGDYAIYELPDKK